MYSGWEEREYKNSRERERVCEGEQREIKTFLDGWFVVEFIKCNAGTGDFPPPPGQKSEENNNNDYNALNHCVYFRWQRVRLWTVPISTILRGNFTGYLSNRAGRVPGFVVVFVCSRRRTRRRRNKNTRSENSNISTETWTVRHTRTCSYPSPAIIYYNINAAR